MYLSNVIAHVVVNVKPNGTRAIIERTKFVTHFALPKTSLALRNVSKGSEIAPTAKSTTA
jgi:hypothetical protein